MLDRRDRELAEASMQAGCRARAAASMKSIADSGPVGGSAGRIA